jgi:CheY-like chemotaxis protein
MARILIVDDNEHLLGIMKQVLGEEHDVVTATSGEEAVEIASRVRPALAILDLQLPVMDGIEAGRRIKDELADDVQIMMLSATADHGRARAEEAGFCDVFLAKPATLDDIKANVDLLLGGSSQAA